MDATRRLPLALLLLALAACGDREAEAEAGAASPAAAPPAAPDSAANLVEERVPDVAQGEPGWEFVQIARGDFDGDSTPERAVLLADVRRYQGSYAWEDGHRWNLYVEEPDGTRTRVYGRFLPTGMLEALLARADSTAPPSIVLVERSPFAVGVYEVLYRGPGEVRAVPRLVRSREPGSGFIEPAR